MAPTDPIRLAALETLGSLINDMAGVSLAQITPNPHPEGPALLLVRRGTTPCDVSVVITCETRDDAPLRLRYQLTVFTEIGWAYYGDSFRTLQADTGDEALGLLGLFVPLTP